MKATIEFNLPEDREEYEMHMNAGKYFSVLFEFDNWLRSQLKHHGRSEDFQEIRDKLWEFLNDENIQLC